MQGTEFGLHFGRRFNGKKERCRIAGQAGQKEYHDQQPDQRDKAGEGAFADESEHWDLDLAGMDGERLAAHFASIGRSNRLAVVTS
ncbi:hypothetical protein D3C87_1671970 [compost metagenome]